MNPGILGIVNITTDSFSDGGQFLDPLAAIAHAKSLLKAGAHAVDLGAASSNPDATAISADIEISRLDPVVRAFPGQNISIDTFSPDVQRYAAKQNVAFINDIHGFPDSSVYQELAASKSKLIVMHSVQATGRAQKLDIGPDEILNRLFAFFDQRLAELREAVTADRLIIDPGMGFFLSSNPESSFAALRAIPTIKARYGLPVLISVSRKSFLGAVTGRPVSQRNAASLACELGALRLGADMIRTHDVEALVDGIAVANRLTAD
ncbi:MAG: dihydropteroate synthase [Spirochaetia bacterium]|nr:dihydropteroate synthase [Spirochaetia bacterium]